MICKIFVFNLIYSIYLSQKKSKYRNFHIERKTLHKDVFDLVFCASDKSDLADVDVIVFICFFFKQLSDCFCNLDCLAVVIRDTYNIDRRTVFKPPIFSVTAADVSMHETDVRKYGRLQYERSDVLHFYKCRDCF